MVAKSFFGSLRFARNWSLSMSIAVSAVAGQLSQGHEQTLQMRESCLEIPIAR